MGVYSVLALRYAQIYFFTIYIFNTCFRVLLTWASMGGGYCAIGSRFVGRGGGPLRGKERLCFTKTVLGASIPLKRAYLRILIPELENGIVNWGGV